MRSSKLREAY